MTPEALKNQGASTTEASLKLYHADKGMGKKPPPSLSIAAFIEGEAPTQKKGLATYERLRITDYTDIPQTKVFISINSEIIATGGDLIAFSGGVKTGKSSIQDPIIAGALTTNGVIEDPVELLEILPNPQQRAVIHIDTEQSKGKHKDKLLKILRRAKLSTCPPHFLSYNLRELNLDEYQPFTTGMCDAAAAEFGGIHLIIIDGIADYISDPNDTGLSNGIVKYFEQIAIKYECPVLVIIHTNPNSDKERGNLGSQCIRKAASVLSVKCEGEISFLEPKYLRNAGRGKVPIIEFMYNSDKGYHVCCGTRSETGQQRKIGRNATLQNMVDAVFAPPKALEYRVAIAEIMRHLDKAERTAKEVFKEIKTLEFITQGPDRYWRKR